MKRICLYLLIILAFPSISNAQDMTVKGVTFAEQVSVGERVCTFNGAGVRKKLIISVYVGGLYLEAPTSDAATVIESDQAKRVMLHFLYSEVSGEQLVDAWNEGFEKNAPQAVTSLSAEIQLFNSWFTQPIRKGERIVISYLPGIGTEVEFNGTLRGTIPGEAFMQALFSVWFGPHPPSDDLKEGMLGE